MVLVVPVPKGGGVSQVTASMVAHPQELGSSKQLNKVAGEISNVAVNTIFIGAEFRKSRSTFSYSIMILARMVVRVPD